MNVTIIGGGRIGIAIAEFLKKKELTLEIWDLDPEKSLSGKSLADVIEPAEVIFMCVPSQAMRPAAAGVAEHIKDGTMVVSLSKGIDSKTHQTMDEVLADELPKRAKLAMMNGPMLAKEIMDGMGAAALLATKEKEDFENLEKLFEGTGFKLEYSNDVHGASVAGVLKNIYAIGLGISQGLGWGDNMKGWLVAESAKEMMGIIEELGGKKETILTQAGLGDLVATGYSPLSSNHRYGKTIIEKGECDIRAEGCVSFSSMVELLGKKGAKYPLYSALEEIIMKGKPAKEVFKRFTHAQT